MTLRHRRFFHVLRRFFDVLRRSSTFIDVLRRKLTSAALGNISPPPPLDAPAVTDPVEREEIDPVKDESKRHDLGRCEVTPGPLTPSRSESLNLSPTWVAKEGEERG